MVDCEYKYELYVVGNNIKMKWWDSNECNERREAICRSIEIRI